MGRSKHRKGHKQKVQAHKQRVQDKRIYIKKLVDDLEVAMLKAEIDQPAGLLQIMEDQPTMYVTGYQPLESQDINL